MKILCQQPQSSPTAPTRLLGKKPLRQQLGSPVGEGLLPLPTANGEAVGEADGGGTVWPRRGFANSFSFPTGMLLGKNPFANSRTLPSVIGFWAVGEDFFPGSRIFLLGKSFFANSSGLGCWESSGLLAKPQFPVVNLARNGLWTLFLDASHQSTIASCPLGTKACHWRWRRTLNQTSLL
jgi:hypothetical protein